MENKISSLIYFLVVASLLTSCSALKSTNSNTTYNNQSTSPRFIDGIEITPGMSKHEMHHIEKEIKQSERLTAKRQGQGIQPYNNNTENVTGLQAKYCVILNVPIEEMQNDGKLLQEVDDWWGTPYRLGGSTKSGIDCSAFSQMVLQDIYAKNIPRTAQQQYDNSNHSQTGEQIQKGDLVFFGSSERNITHVGVYLANNKFVHASTSRGVMISDLNDVYWGKKYVGSGRYYASLSSNIN